MTLSATAGHCTSFTGRAKIPACEATSTYKTWATDEKLDLHLK